MAGFNLHQIVRGAISINHPDETVGIVRSTGQENDGSGFVTPQYAELEEVQAQVQSLSDAALYHANMAGQNEIVRRVYLYAPSNMSEQASGIFRPLSRNGDFLRRSDGTWWLVDAVLDNFSDVGWVCVRVVLQVLPPEGYEDGNVTVL